MANISFERQLRPGNLCLECMCFAETMGGERDCVLRRGRHYEIIGFCGLVKYRTTAGDSLILRKNVSKVRAWLVSDTGSGVRKLLST
jgi:hypothetical protein